MKTLIALLSLAYSVTAYAKPVEIWECQEPYGNWSNILVVVTIEEGRQLGIVAVAGITHHAQFSVNGFDRRWDFGSKEDPLRYSFVVRPNGDAQYFDFGSAKTAKPSNFMHCRQRTLSE
jgi:hypothetical protein